MIRAALLASLVFAGAVAAQESKEPEKKPERPQERPRLNLRLDNPSSFATTAPAEPAQPKGLPALGGDARRIEPAPGPVGTRSEGGPYPKDTSPTGH